MKLATQDTGRKQIKPKAHHYVQTNTNNLNSTGGKDEPNIDFMRKSFYSCSLSICYHISFTIYIISICRVEFLVSIVSSKRM